MRSSQTWDSLGARVKAAELGAMRDRRCIHNQHHTPWVLVIWGFLSASSRFLSKDPGSPAGFWKHCHGVSTEHSLCCPKPKIPFRAQPRTPTPFTGSRFHPEEFCRSQFLCFPCSSISSQAVLAVGAAEESWLL